MNRIEAVVTLSQSLDLPFPFHVKHTAYESALLVCVFRVVRGSKPNHLTLPARFVRLTGAGTRDVLCNFDVQGDESETICYTKMEFLFQRGRRGKTENTEFGMKRCPEISALSVFPRFPR